MYGENTRKVCAMIEPPTRADTENDDVNEVGGGTENVNVNPPSAVIIVGLTDCSPNTNLVKSDDTPVVGADFSRTTIVQTMSGPCARACESSHTMKDELSGCPYTVHTCDPFTIILLREVTFTEI